MLHYIDEKSHNVISYAMNNLPTKSSQINDIQAKKHDDNQISSPLNIDLNNENSTNDSKPSDEPSFSVSSNDLGFSNDFSYLNSADSDSFDDIIIQNEILTDYSWIL